MSKWDWDYPSKPLIELERDRQRRLDEARMRELAEMYARIQPQPEDHVKQDDTTKENKLLDMIASRLRLPRLKLPFQRIHAHEGADNVSVWVVVNDQAVTIADEAALFPSDKLITQLRLLIKKEDE